jgi:hypothetical protein
LSSSEEDDTSEALDIKPPQKQAGKKIPKKKLSEKTHSYHDTKRHHSDKYSDLRREESRSQSRQVIFVFAQF